MSTDVVEQLLSQASAHVKAGRRELAGRLFQQVLNLQPCHARAHAGLGELALLAGQLDTAERHLGASLSADPGLITAANNLGILYRKTNRSQQACALLNAVIDRAPEFPEARLNLGNALLELGDYDAAIAAYEDALRLRPRYLKALVNLARVCHLSLRIDRCLDCLRRAAAVSDSPRPHSMALFYAMFVPGLPAEQVAAWAADWDARFAAPLRPPGEELPPLRLPARTDPDRLLRIGYVSPNFRQHANGLLIEPVLAGHERTRYVPYCYSDLVDGDDVTERFRGHAHTFRDTAGLSDEQLAEVIRQDEIDILIDLNLHLEKSRLGVFARRAAPVQINYLAYPFTSGVRTMDYRIADAVLDPPGSPRLGPEALIRLRASYWLYRPHPNAPAPAARTGGRFTFANFNFTQKLNPAVAASSARIVNRVPGTRLLLLADFPAAQQPHFARLFGEAGLDPARLDLVGPLPQHEHLDRFLQADLCLDPFPTGGHTTTLDALWMGVPMLTLPGQPSYTRGAASILSRLDCTRLIAHSVEDYEDTAVALAANPERLAEVRHKLRERMGASVLCDEKKWLADFERGLRQAWQRYCLGLPPAEIDLALRET